MPSSVDARAEHGAGALRRARERLRYHPRMRSGIEPQQGTALHKAKQSMRGTMLALRDALPEPMRERASRAIAERIAALPSFRAMRTLLLTLPFRSEWNMRPLADDVLASGRTLVLPRVDPVARMLTLHAVADLGRDIAPGYLGIPEPRADTPRVDAEAVEWALVPGVAFDDGGRRLGYGGGFYDRLIPALGRDTPLVSGAFEAQIVPEVPAGPNDHRVHAVATEARLLLPPT
jgi:5-formyltetrahydrofolate cyclo-ligase